MIDAGQLEDWSLRAVQALQDICDDAQEAAGNPDGEDQCLDLRALIAELDCIMLGRPSWQQRLLADDNDGEPNL